MASLFPAIDVARRSAANAREVDVLERLAQALPEGYEIFHSVNWHSLHQETDRHGEIDLVVLDPLFFLTFRHWS